MIAETVTTGVHQGIFGRRLDSYDVDKLAFLSAGISSSAYVGRPMADAKRAANAMDLLDYAIKHITMEGKRGIRNQAGPSCSCQRELIVGWFDRTMPSFLDQHPNSQIPFPHVDCDLHSSTQTIFHYLNDRIAPGTITVFDEYYKYPGWELHEFLEFQEYLTTSRLRYDYLGLVPSHQQVPVCIKG